jgi:hypothetical protein
MAINKPLQQAIGIAPGSVATIRIPPEALTMIGAKLIFAGTTFTKSHIDRVRVKVGARVIWDVTGPQLNAINNYKNGADSARTMLIDFTERTQAIFPVKEIGGLDLMALAAVGEVFLEIYINAAAVAPAMSATGYFEQQQGNPMVLKLVPFTFTTNASGRFTLPLNLRGSLLKRVWLFYTGTAWTAVANGNVNRMEVKKNGVVMFDQADLDNRFDQVHFKKVPQPGLYCIDFIMDDNHDAQVTTIRNANGVQVYDTFEFNAYITDAAGASVTALAEVIDTPTNL